MDNNPFISIIIPCRNEENHIGACIDSILNNNYSADKIEILVIDGMSEDNTRDIVRKYSEKYPMIRLVENPKKIVPSALNEGLRISRGDVIIRMDAHNIYKNDYILNCVRYIKETDADNVGGIWITLPGKDTIVARAIALALSHPFGVGNASYRLGSNEVRYVDTVPFGCYRREVFERIGFFDEDLVRNQDDEFNHRLVKKGGKILLVPEIVSYYYSRTSLSKLWKMYYQYGYFKPLAALKVGSISTWRQLVPPVFVMSLFLSFGLAFVFRYSFILFLAIICLYLITNMVFSFSIAARKGLRYLPILPLVFATNHFAYGLGYLMGVWKFVILKRRRKHIADMPLTR